MSLLTRFLNTFRSRALKREFDEELQFHLEKRIETNLASGMSIAEAEAAAREEFGSLENARNGMREVRMMNGRVVGAFAAGLTIGVLATGLIWHWEASRSLPLYRVGQEGVSSPVLVHEAKPRYTPEALRAKIAGFVMIECVVEPSGTCDGVRVTKSLDPGLDREAVNALQSWRFQPGQHLGKPVPVLVSIEIAFTLRS